MTCSCSIIGIFVRRDPDCSAEVIRIHRKKYANAALHYDIWVCVLWLGVNLSSYIRTSNGNWNKSYRIIKPSSQWSSPPWMKAKKEHVHLRLVCRILNVIHIRMLWSNKPHLHVSLRLCLWLMYEYVKGVQGYYKDHSYTIPSMKM